MLKVEANSDPEMELDEDVKSELKDLQVDLDNLISKRKPKSDAKRSRPPRKRNDKLPRRRTKKRSKCFVTRIEYSLKGRLTCQV